MPLVVGRYVLYGEIGSGGMATVYFGRMVGPAGFARPVAVKRLHPQFSRDPDFVRMLLDEGRLGARIQHPNVVPTLDIVTQDDEVFVVMEYVPGTSLSRLMRAAKEAGTPIPILITVSLVAGMLQGLHAAHEAKDDQGARLELVHRDVSPQNALIGADGVPRLIDFGIAKATSRLQSTREGSLKGKLAYMAPEQALGERVTPRTDVYSASIILWEALTSSRLFEADNEAELVRKLVSYQAPPPSSIRPNVPPSLDRAVLRGLEREPAKRFGSAREMAAHLQACLGVAGPLEIGEWLDRVAGDELRQQAARLEAAERQGSLRADTEIQTAVTPGRRGPEGTGSKIGHVGLFLRSLDNDYQWQLREDCLAAARRCGFRLREVVGHNDAARQKRQIEECLREPVPLRPSVFLVNPVDEEALRDAAFASAGAGVGWVSLNRSADYLNDLRLDYPEQVFFSVCPDQHQIGRIHGRLLRFFLPRGGLALYVQGPPGTSSARHRREATLRELRGSNVRLAIESADWTVEGGANAARRWIHQRSGMLPEPLVVCAQNDPMVVGARSVLLEAMGVRDDGRSPAVPEPGRNVGAESRAASKVPLVAIGCDGTASYGRTLIAEGVLSATVVVPTTAGRAVLEVSARGDHSSARAADISLCVEPLPTLRALETQRRNQTV
jgi:ABC-type sugar transport system substrate-binding protein